MLAGRSLLFPTLLLFQFVVCKPIPKNIVSLTFENATLSNNTNSEVDSVIDLALAELVKNVENKTIDPSIYIGLRENDWRDAHEGRMIIWSHESQHHPDYAKTYSSKTRKYTQRQSKSSQLMSFCILGSVIGFILYTYFSHVLMVRKLNREIEASRLRELVHRSALIMAGSVNQNEYDFSERRRSLINMFQSFKL